MLDEVTQYVMFCRPIMLMLLDEHGKTEIIKKGPSPRAVINLQVELTDESNLKFKLNIRMSARQLGWTGPVYPKPGCKIMSFDSLMMPGFHFGAVTCYPCRAFFR